MNVRQEVTDLTACRAAFALWVFIYHVDLHANFSAGLGPLGTLIRHGYLGVDGFFVLSGLVLARLHTEYQTSLAGYARFWGKRLARIYPVHLATILILAVLLAVGAGAGLHPADPARFGLHALIQNLLLVHGWGLSDDQAWNYPSWSVSTEWLGYLLFPFIVLFLARCPDIVCGQITLVTFPLLALLSARSGYGLNLTYHDVLVRFFLDFVMGVASSRVISNMADELPTGVFAVMGLIWAVAGAMSGWDMFTIAGLFIMMFSLAQHADADRRPLFPAGLLRRFGLLSYSFYMSFGIAEMLLAQFFIHQGWDPAGRPLAYGVAMLGVTLLIAILLYFLVEMPCRRSFDQILFRLPPVKTKSAAPAGTLAGKAKRG